ncbi:MAG: 30S ribosomal protein S27e [Candidatus Bathyarchaeia archaeon]
MARITVIPKPESSFLKVRCPKCSNEQIVFDRCSVIVRCNVCEEVLAEPTGGKASIKGEVLQVFT